MIFRKFSDADIKEILKGFVLLVDTREQENKHITYYCEKRNIEYKKQALDTGDYSFMIKPNFELNIDEMNFSNIFAIERKNSVDELSGNLTSGRDAFENELIRAQCLKRFILIIEDSQAITSILNENYRSKLNPNAFFASLNSLSTRHGFSYFQCDKAETPSFIYAQFTYYLRNYLLNKIYK